MVDKTFTKEFSHGLTESYQAIYDECNNTTLNAITTTGFIDISAMSGVSIGIKTDGNLTYDIEVSFNRNKSNIFKAKVGGSLNNASRVEVLTGWAFWVRCIVNPSSAQKILVQVGGYK